jgi:hypothetical protein
MPVPPFVPPDSNAALASLMDRPQAQENMALMAETMRQRALAQAQIAQSNNCSWYRGTHWYSNPVCVLNTPPAPSLQMRQIEEGRARIAEHYKQLAAQEKQARWVQKIQAARITHADWDAVASSPEVQNMVLDPAVDTSIKALDNGPDVLYYLATDPEAYKKLSSMTVPQQSLEVHRISDKLWAGK